MGRIAEQLDETVAALRREGVGKPSVGIVLGSGLGGFADRLENSRRIPYSRIRNFPVSKVVGHAGEVVVGTCEGTRVAVLSGRVHYYEGHPMATVVFPVRVLARLGTHIVVLTNAAGGITRRLSPGDLMLIADHINATGANPLIGENDDDLGERFPDMSQVYSHEARALAKGTAETLGIPVFEGIYVALAGPSYETPAEIRMWAALGVDAVGMSTVPEAIALHHMRVTVLGLSCITNMAAGILEKPLDHREVLETTERVRERFITLLSALVPKLAASMEGGRG